MADETTVEQVTKLDAVKRQLRVAITLFFEDKDPLPTYTLACAVQELLRGLLKPMGGGSFLKDNELIMPERKKEYLALVNRPQNFLKHADRDRDEVLDFVPRSVLFTLMDCVDMYRQFTGRHLRESAFVLLWAGYTNPDFLLPGRVAETVALLRRHIPRADKALFLEVLTKHAHELLPSWE